LAEIGDADTAIGGQLGGLPDHWSGAISASRHAAMKAARAAFGKRG
jgi:hypothetical protein